MATSKRHAPPTLSKPELKWYDQREYIVYRFEAAGLESWAEGIRSSELVTQSGVEPFFARPDTTPWSVKNLPRLTKSDLAWFDLGKYASTKLKALDLSGWIRILMVRQLVFNLLADGRHDLALGFAEVLQADPLDCGPVDVPIIHGDHFSDTATVCFLRAAQIAKLTEEVLRNELSDHELVSPALMERWEEPSIRFATVAVDLTATRTQIRSDFNTWLDRMDFIQAPPKARNFSNPKLLGQWIAGKYLPCFDLDLFASLHGSYIPSKLMAERLQLNVKDFTELEVKDAVKKCRNCHDVFTIDTVLAMARKRDALVATTKTSLATPGHRKAAPARKRRPSVKPTD
jgi:hypothetical protein